MVAELLGALGHLKLCSHPGREASGLLPGLVPAAMVVAAWGGGQSL